MLTSAHTPAAGPLGSRIEVDRNLFLILPGCFAPCQVRQSNSQPIQFKHPPCASAPPVARSPQAKHKGWWMQDEGDTRYWLPPVENGKPQVVTDARKQRGDVVAVEGDRGGKQFRSLDHPLDFYVLRGSITGRQYRAGKHLFVLWMQGKPPGYSQVRYEESDGGPQTMAFVPPGFGAVEYREAMARIRDMEIKHIVFAVCCIGHHASQCVVANSDRSARRKGMLLLADGLDQLADHFKYDK